MVKYYPYLRGKQYECLALRAMCEELKAEQIGKVVPIIEPVRRVEKDAAMLAALSAMLDKGMHFGYIMNPQSGEFDGLSEVYYPEEVQIDNIHPLLHRILYDWYISPVLRTLHWYQSFR